MAIFLVMTPVVALLAWTFLTVGSTTRNRAIGEERRVRALQAAEAAIRYHLYTGKSGVFELNGCRTRVGVTGATVEAVAVPEENGLQTVSVKLELERGFVIGRSTNEES